MKWMLALTILGLLSSCCCTTPEYVTVQRVKIARVPVRQVTVTRLVTPVIQPVYVDYVEPIDVTTTAIDYY